MLSDTTVVELGASPETVTVPSVPVIYRPLLGPIALPSLFGIGTEGERNGKYVYVDYEPPSDIPLRYSANYREISAWVLQEYGLKVASRHVTQVKRKHGVYAGRPEQATAGGRGTSEGSARDRSSYRSRAKAFLDAVKTME